MNLKELLKYVIISLVQGFTEPLPISSSGHMIITKQLFGFKDTDLTLEIFLNFASMIAIFLFMFTKRLNFKDTLFNTSILKILHGRGVIFGSEQPYNMHTGNTES